jgi:hypothetical protein
MSFSASYALVNPRIVSPRTNIPRLSSFPEADSAAYKTGQFVYLSSGAITEVATDGTKILGIVLDDGNNTSSASATHQVEIIDPEALLKVPTTSAGTATLCTSFVQGVSYGLHVASNVSYADKADTTNDALVYVGPCYDAKGDADYWGLFRVLPTVAQSATGA